MAAYVRKPCERCGGQKEPTQRGRICASCWPAHFAANRVKYGGRHHCGSLADDHYTETCPTCTQNLRAIRLEGARRGADTRARNGTKARPAHADRYWSGMAHSAVSKAIKRGLLPRLDGTIACTDCGEAAHEYDHRDYGRPLDVQPVCRSCNKQRGAAVWPSAEVYQFPLVKGVSTPAKRQKAAA